MLECYKQLEEECLVSGCSSFDIALEATFYVIGYTATLRGEEIVKSDLLSVVKHWEASGRNDPPHVVVGLIGRFKGEIGFSYHVIPLVVKTKSGMEPRKWIGCLKDCYEAKGIRHGALFRNPYGSRMKIADMTETFMRRLSLVQLKRPDILPAMLMFKPRMELNDRFNAALPRELRIWGCHRKLQKPITIGGNTIRQRLESPSSKCMNTTRTWSCPCASFYDIPLVCDEKHPIYFNHLLLTFLDLNFVQQDSNRFHSRFNLGELKFNQGSISFNLGFSGFGNI
jgi:hypothetical protein